MRMALELAMRMGRKNGTNGTRIDDGTANENDTTNRIQNERNGNGTGNENGKKRGTNGTGMDNGTGKENGTTNRIHYSWH